MWLEFTGDQERRVYGWRGRQSHFTQGILGQHMRLRLHSKYNVKTLEGISKRRREGHELVYIFRRPNFDSCVENEFKEMVE